MLKSYLQLLSTILFLQTITVSSLAQQNPSPELFHLSKQKRTESDSLPGVFTISQTVEPWKATETAIIICDMWNQHWCKGATERVAEMAPVLNNLITIARNKGSLIVHAPSDCMKYYANYPGRKLAQKYKSRKAEKIITDGNLPSEKNAVWPIDQSDEGCDDMPECAHGSPWSHQIDDIKIMDKDAISDSGAEIYGLLRIEKLKT